MHDMVTISEHLRWRAAGNTTSQNSTAFSSKNGTCQKHIHFTQTSPYYSLTVCNNCINEETKENQVT